MTKIHTIDLNFQGVSHTTAVYLLEAPDGPVLIETGPGSTLQTCLASLAKLGVSPADVRHVLVTHIHLDHAGAAGWWAQQGAQVYVHYFGARHLIAPAKLMASASRIYGDMMDTLWGEMLPAPAENITEVHDNDVLHVNGLEITALETPGHARHHHVYQLGDIAFTGDAAGLRLLDLPLADIPAPPPEFDREVWLHTLDRIQHGRFATIYPTHFGAVSAVDAHLNTFRQLIEDVTSFVGTRMANGWGRDEILNAYIDWNHGRARDAGLTEEQIQQYDTANPLYMSVDGIMRYWRKRWENEGTS